MALVRTIKKTFRSIIPQQLSKSRRHEVSELALSHSWRKLDILLIPIIAFIIITKQRELLNLNVLMICVSALYLGSSIFLTQQQHSKLNLLDLSVIAVVSVEVVSYFTSSYRANSFYYLPEILFLFLFFFLVRFNLSHDYQRIALFALLSIWAGALSCAAIFEFIERFNYLNSLGFSDVTNFKQQFSFFTPTSLTTGDWVTIYLALLPFPLILLLEKKVPLLTKALLLICTEVTLISLFLTLSRGIYVALLSFLVIGGALIYSYKIVQLKSLLVFLGSLTLVTILILIPFRGPVLTTASLFKTTSQVRSIEGRSNVWGNAVRLFEEKPVFGLGAYNFPLGYMSVKAQTDETVFAVSPFNFFLQVLVEKGIVGLAAYSLLIFSFFKVSFRAIKRARSQLQRNAAILFVAAFSAVLVRDLSYSSILPNVSLTLLLWLMFAINAQTAEQGASPRGLKATPFWRRVGTPSLLIIGLILFICVAVRRETISKAEDSFQSFTRNLIEGNLDYANRDIEAAVRLFPDNAQFTSYQAVLHTQMIRTAFSPEDILSNKVTFSEEESEHIKSAIGLYERSLELNPKDDLFHHNLGWLFLMQQDRVQALSHFQKAVDIDNSNALYHVSLGLLYEYVNEQEDAFKEYSFAFRLSPSLLDSRFFADLIRRAPAATEKVITETIYQLETELQKQSSPFIKGKLGYFYLFKNQINKAKDLLAQASSELPNLSGPWFNLGYLYELEGNEEGMFSCYVKATFTAPNDIQPWIRLGDFYHRQHRAAEAIFSYQRGIKNWLTQPTERVWRATHIYHFYSSLPLANGIIPKSLNSYCRPMFPVAETFMRLAQSYEENNDYPMYEYYREKAREFQLMDQATAQ